MKIFKSYAAGFVLFASLIPVFSQTSIKSEEAKAVIESRLNGTYKKTDQTPVIYNEDFEKGKELFSLNEPAKAIPYFEKSLESENVDPAVYVYLGVAYYQTKDYNKSLAICVQGLAKDNTDHKVLAYNAGNSCYAMGNYMRADASYAIAIREDSNYAPPVLNRANAELKLDRLEDARNNYIKYLELDPETPQRAKIEELIRLLQQEIELRAKQKPEIINPDEFVENEKMEVADEMEKVNEILPVYAAEKDDEMEKVVLDAAAPALPAVKNEDNNGEKISENLAALQNENQSQKSDEKDVSEKVDANVPALPAVAENSKNDDSEKIQDNLVAALNQNQNQNEKVEEEKSEKVRENPPLLEVQKETEKAEETLVTEKIPDAVKDENEKVDSEKVNPATLATDDYQKNEEAKEKAEKEAELARQKAEEEAEFANSKANEEEAELARLKAEQDAQEAQEKEAELERQRQAEEAAKQAELERQKQEELARQKAAEEEAARQAELERQKQEELARQKAEEEARAKAEAERKAALEKAEAERKAAEEAAKKAQEVPDDVKVNENDDGTVDIKIPTLSFKINSSELTENKSNTETVQKVYDILSDKKYSNLKVTITGYVNPDNDEWTEDENKLALARAESVKKRLVKMGISASRIKAQHGSGKTSNKEYNRRVEFLLSKD